MRNVSLVVLVAFVGAGLFAARAGAKPARNDPPSRWVYTLSVSVQLKYELDAECPRCTGEPGWRWPGITHQHTEFVGQQSKRFWIVRRGTRAKPRLYMTPVGDSHTPIYLTTRGGLILSGTETATGCLWATSTIGPDPSAGAHVSLVNNRLSLEVGSDASVIRKYTGQCGYPSDWAGLTEDLGNWALELSPDDSSSATMLSKLGVISFKSVKGFHLDHKARVVRHEDAINNSALHRVSHPADYQTNEETWSYDWTVTLTPVRPG